jgi:hypothetical protein
LAESKLIALSEVVLVSFFLIFSVQPRRGGQKENFPMLQIVIACTRNGQFVPTGIETDVDTFIALPEALSLTRCPACGGNHYWTKSQTWICNTESSSRALLPAEVVGGH